MLLIGLTGKRGVGKTTAANMLAEHYGFARVHPFDPGKRMLYTYYTDLGIAHDIAERMLYTDLKDTPCDKLPGGVASRFVMEKLGKFMGTTLGQEWTLGAELDRLQRSGQHERIVVESIVYEYKSFVARGGIIARITRPGASLVADDSDAAQAAIPATYIIDNDLNKNELGSKLDIMLRDIEEHEPNNIVAINTFRKRST